MRVLRVIARLNMGGPAHHVGLLSAGLDPERYATLLVHGAVGPGEASLEASVRARGAAMAAVPGLSPELRPHDDARALGALVRSIRRHQPDIVHTHTAKAGMLGRLAAVLAGGRRPIVVHTYHGHVLEGYFGPARNALYRGLERRLGAVSDALVGVSAATVDDLVRLGIADRAKFRVIPVGLDLEPFLAAAPGAGADFRREAGTAQGEILVTFVGRLVAIKRVDVLIRAVAHARSLGALARLAVVGDGDRRDVLERLAGELAISEYVHFAGYRSDMVRVAVASDVAALSSDNEGTPVSLIEAAAAATPAVATRVGGVPDVVVEGAGLLVPAGDHQALGRQIARISSDGDLRASLGEASRRHVARRFSANRLVADIDGLYRELFDPSRAIVPGDSLHGPPGPASIQAT